jgi:surfeit locus 1 family protein
MGFWIFFCRSFIIPDGEDTGGGLFGNPDTVGYNVVTPFIVEGTGGKAILVNRGWVTKKNVNPATRQDGQV